MNHQHKHADGSQELKAGRLPATVAGGMRINEANHVPLKADSKHESQTERRLGVADVPPTDDLSEEELIRREEERILHLEKMDELQRKAVKSADREQQFAEHQRQQRTANYNDKQDNKPIQQPRYHN